MAKLVEGKSIIVTGGGGGIGEGIVRDLAAEGARVVVADIDLAAAERVANAVRKDGGDAIAVKVDVVDRASVQALIQAAVRAHGRLDVMFNNAGVSKAGLFLEATEADWAKIMGINGMGVLIGMQEAAKQMIAQKTGGQDHQYRIDRRQDRRVHCDDLLREQSLRHLAVTGCCRGSWASQYHGELLQPWLREDPDVGRIGQGSDKGRLPARAERRRRSGQGKGNTWPRLDASGYCWRHHFSCLVEIRLHHRPKSHGRGWRQAGLTTPEPIRTGDLVERNE